MLLPCPECQTVYNAEPSVYKPGMAFQCVSCGAVVVVPEDDAQEELATLFEDIEKIIDENDALVYDTSVVPNGTTTSMTIDSLTTDEGVIAPLGIGEMLVTVRY